ncbi:hypothetical protein OH76DRAFT_1311403, partial [Lentinus brumalis]
APLPMPYRGARTAPMLDPGDPLTVVRFFNDLDRMFRRSRIDDDTERLDYTLSYIPNELWRQWQALALLPESSTYDGFKRLVLGLYPEVDAQPFVSFERYEQLVAYGVQRQFTSLESYSAFYRDYYPLTASLVARADLTVRAASGNLLSMLGPEVHAAVKSRLSVRYPDHHRLNPWPLADVNAAIVWTLLRPPEQHPPSPLPSPAALIRTVGPSLSFVAPTTPSPPITASADPPPSPLLLASVINSHTPVPSPPPAHPVTSRHCPAPVPPPSVPSHPSPAADLATHVPDVTHVSGCHYCGKPDCWIRDCPEAQHDVATGLCRRRLDGRLVLSDGRFVPRSLPGSCMRDRV